MSDMHSIIDQIFSDFDENSKTLATMNFIFALEKMPSVSKEILKKALRILGYFFEVGLEQSLELKEGKVRFRNQAIELIYEEIHSPAINILHVLMEFKTVLAQTVKEPSLLVAMTKKIDRVYKDFYLNSRLPK